MLNGKVLSRVPEQYHEGFRFLAQLAGESNAATAATSLGWVRDDDEFGENDFVPELILRIKLAPTLEGE